MKLNFNDATEISVRQVEPHGDYLRVLTVGNTPEQLKVLFTDSSRTARMTVQERGQTVATYEGYTAFYRTEIYTGKIYGVVMYKAEKTPEVQSSMVQLRYIVQGSAGTYVADGLGAGYGTVSLCGSAPGTGRHWNWRVGTAGIYKSVYDWRPGDTQRKDIGILSGQQCMGAEALWQEVTE